VFSSGELEGEMDSRAGFIPILAVGGNSNLHPGALLDILDGIAVGVEGGELAESTITKEGPLRTPEATAAFSEPFKKATGEVGVELSVVEDTEDDEASIASCKSKGSTRRRGVEIGGPTVDCTLAAQASEDRAIG
jgi:hypothetical protein